MAKMTVRAFIEVATQLPPHVSVLLRGDHGIGKSQILRKLARLVAAKEGIKDYPFIDRRLSQMTEGDLIGLPSTDDSVTRFNPPDWFHQAIKKPCYILLDEFNRGTHEVINGGFQIVLDYELNGHKLHEQTRVGAAINTNAIYSVNEMDPALLDRFFIVDLRPDVQDWLAWARDEGNVEPVVVDFIAHEEKWLDPPAKYDPREKHPSRRSWERVSNSLRYSKLVETPDHPNFYNMCLGFLGNEAAIKFREFAKNHNNRFTAEEVLTDYNKVKSKINKLGQERMNIAIDKVSDYILKNCKTLTQKQGENCALFMKDLTNELRTTFWGRITVGGVDQIELIKSVHQYLAPLILDCFSVPMGEAGVGVVPNIPGIFRAQQKKSA